MEHLSNRMLIALKHVEHFDPDGINLLFGVDRHFSG
jgi:hypothetical protein